MGDKTDLTGTQSRNQLLEKFRTFSYLVVQTASHASYALSTAFGVYTSAGGVLVLVPKCSMRVLHQK